MYRVVCSSYCFEKSDIKVVWEGSDILELSREYPPSRIFGADPLGHLELEDGYIRYDYRFEKLENDAWVEIEDPRVRLNKRLTLEEEEIDRENRRRFPGDYL